MVAHLLAQTHIITPGADGKARSIDPAGLFGAVPAFVAPVIDRTGIVYDQFVTNGGTWTFAPTLSNAPAQKFWHFDCHPDEATINPKTGAVSLDTSTMPAIDGAIPNQSVYIEIVCSNAAGEDRIVIRLHIGKTAGQIKYMGPSETYQDLDSAGAAMVAGDTLIVRDGTYTGENNTVRPSGGGTTIGFPAGTAATPTIAMAESPGKWVIDGESTISCFNAVGNKVPVDWPGAAGGEHTTDQSHIWVFGMAPKNSTREMRFAYSQKNQFRYCLMGHTHKYTSTHNTAGIEVNRSDNVVLEHCYQYGYSRYSQSAYESREVMMRRGLSRYAAYYGTEPANCGFSLYRGKNSRVQNSWVVDSNESKWVFTASHSVTMAFQIASTGADTYPTNNKFQRCGAVDVFNGGFHSWGSEDLTLLTVEDFAQINVNAKTLTGGDGAFDGNGKCVIRGHTIWDGDYNTFTGSHLMNSKGTIDIQNALYDFISTGVAQSRLVNTWGSGTSVIIDNISIPGFTDTVSSPAPTNRNDIAATAANGAMYPIRLEDNSALKNASLGADNLDYCIGKQGTYLGDPDSETVTTTPALPFQMEKTAMESWRNTSWTGPNVDTGLGGSATLSGNFGVADVDDSPSYNILASMGNPVFPLRFSAIPDTATSASCHWEHPAKKYHDQIVAYDVLYQNVTDSGALTYFASVDRLTNEKNVTGLTAGKLYRFFVRSRYVDGRLSGVSYKSEVQL